MDQDTSNKYYKELIDLKDVQEVETQIQHLLEVPIESISELEKWLKAEKDLTMRISEAMIGHQVDFYQNTEDADLKSIYLHDQQVIQPLLMKYEAKLNEKLCKSPYVHELDENRYCLNASCSGIQSKIIQRRKYSTIYKRARNLYKVR